MIKINIVQVLNDSWTKVRTNFWVITNSILLAALVFFGANIFSQYTENKGPVLIFLSFAVTIVVESFMMFALMKFFLKIYNNQETTVLEMFQNIKGFYKFFILYMALTLATFAGFVLFIFPAIYVFLTYSFSTYIFLDQGIGINESIAESAAISKGHKFELFKFSLALLALNIFGGAFFLVGLVVTLPLTFIAIIEVYKKLSEPVTSESI